MLLLFFVDGSGHTLTPLVPRCVLSTYDKIIQIRKPSGAQCCVVGSYFKTIQECKWKKKKTWEKMQFASNLGKNIISWIIWKDWMFST